MHMKTENTNTTLYYGGDGSNWDDLRFPLSGYQLTSPAGRLDYNFVECTVDFAANARYPEEPICMAAQMPHSKKLNSALEPHIHWIQEEGNVPNWLLAFRAYNNGDLVPAWSFAIPDSTAFNYASGALMQISGFPKIKMPLGEKVSACVDLKLFRDSANVSTLFAGADAYTAAVKAKELDLHYEIDSVGSGLEFVK